MPFTPKFVDLVRNSTSIQGTGPVTLGAAVNGYTGLAAAVTAGEQFYYCIQSNDKAIEREVGRGTMQANGTVARQAISGTLTNFTSGSKTITLVTAAEWFSRLETLKPSSITADVRATLAAANIAEARTAFLLEPGREGIFVFNVANHAVKVAADTAQGIYVAPASDPTGASGAWVRQFSGALLTRWFGAVLNGIANDHAAISAAIALSKALAIHVNGFYKAGPDVQVEAGTAYMGALPLSLTHTFGFRGTVASAGQGFSYATRLKWDNGCDGIQVQRFDTSGEITNDGVTHFGGDGSIIEGLRLSGGYAGVEAEHHAIRVKARCNLVRVFIDGWSGDGVRCHADINPGPSHGNANNGLIDQVTVKNCRDGTSFSGGDVNAWDIRSLDTSSNRRWGRYDNSFLCNTYTAGHSDANATIPGTPPAVVSNGGNRYAVVDGQEAAASTTAPAGTVDTALWLYIGVGGVNAGLNLPAWTSGMALRAGGAARFSNPNADRVLLGFYTESGQGPVQASYPTLIIGGTQGAGVKGTGVVLRNYQGTLNASAIGAIAQSGFGVYLAPDRLEFNRSASDKFTFEWFNNDLVYTALRSALGANWAFRLTGESTAAGGVPKRRMDFPNGFGLANKQILSGTVPPAAGTFVQGDSMRNSAPVAGGPRGWTCVAGGTPGTWLAFYGPTSNADAFGYATGAGGGVVQATSKATAVILNKACGQITTAADALAAGASVSLTLTNSLIAAADVVIVNIASGASANAYSIAVTAVAAGSCRIQMRNFSTGPLSEAVTLNFAVVKGAAA